MHFASSPIDWVPNCLAADCSEALEFWLQNPLLLYHYPAKLAASARDCRAYDMPAKRSLLMRLREVRLKVRAGRYNPGAADGLPVAEMADIYLVADLIADRGERGEVTRFAMRLADCERAWLLDRLNQVYALRERAIAA